MQPPIEKLQREAHAKIIWGDSPAEVKNWLRVSGLSGQETEDIVSESLRERAAEFRKRGLGQILLGSLILIVAACMALAIHHDLFSYTTRRLYGIYLLGATFGLYCFVRGVLYVVSGAKNEGSL